MPEPTEEECAERAEARRRIETFLTRWQQEDFILPGWQILFTPARNGFIAVFQMNHEALPYEMGEAEFSAYARGFGDRRKAVMARPPRTQAVHRELANAT
ncbi:hypothetical protein ACFPC0_11185 [Streptomyces andamanensis]|uniref:Uncharacterized protein n=1 Tax=Streptomyces andamanensis TaxID=1565035 RepID=A0ABV8TCN1_9ACTN